MTAAENNGRADCRRSDIPKVQRRSIQEAIEKLYKIHVKDGQGDKKQNTKEVNRWASFAKALKESLDRGCEPHWHVVMGRGCAYACKVRERSVGVWRIDGLTVVIWKSPGIELMANEEAPGDDASASTESDTAANKTSSPNGDMVVRVLEQSSAETNNETETVIASLKAVVQTTSITEQDAFAQSLRKRLSKELGTIWHVAVGTEFVYEMPEDRRNYVLATVGKTRIICFQHEQFAGTKVDWTRIRNAVPYFFGLLFCFAYLGLNHICAEDFEAKHRVMVGIKNQFCGNWESNVGMLGAVAIATLMIVKTLSKVSKATEKPKIA